MKDMGIGIKRRKKLIVELSISKSKMNRIHIFKIIMNMKINNRMQTNVIIVSWICMEKINVNIS